MADLSIRKFAMFVHHYDNPRIMYRREQFETAVSEYNDRFIAPAHVFYSYSLVELAAI